MWACGVILLSLLSGRSNFFNAPDDLTNLLQLVTLFGKEAMCAAANAMGKNLMVDIPGSSSTASLKVMNPIFSFLLKQKLNYAVLQHLIFTLRSQLWVTDVILSVTCHPGCMYIILKLV